jgi:hypothetical protein
MDVSNYNQVTITFTDGTERDVLFVVRHPRSSWIFAPEAQEYHEGGLEEVSEDYTEDDLRDDLNEFVMFNEAANSTMKGSYQHIFDIKESLLSSDAIREIDAARHTVNNGFAIDHTTDLHPSGRTYKNIFTEDKLESIAKTLDRIKDELSKTSSGPRV